MCGTYGGARPRATVEAFPGIKFRIRFPSLDGTYVKTITLHPQKVTPSLNHLPHRPIPLAVVEPDAATESKLNTTDNLLPDLSEARELASYRRARKHSLR